MHMQTIYFDQGTISYPKPDCAPIAHKTLGTYPQRTLRFSFRYFNTHEEVNQCVRALEEIFHGI